MKKSDFRTLPVSEDYPYEIEGITQRSFTTKEDESLATINDTAELVVIKKVHKSKEVKHDALPYVKFFKPAAETLKHLSIPGSNLLYLIVARLEINSKQICLNEDDFIDHFGYAQGSKRLFYQAVSELAEKNIITKRAGYARCYWVNANIIFNGDRTKIMVAPTTDAALSEAVNILNKGIVKHAK
jgi:hypothetical protein